MGMSRCPSRSQRHRQCGMSCRDGWQLLQPRDKLAQPPGSPGHVPLLAGVTSPAHCGVSVQVIPAGMVPAGCCRHWGEHPGYSRDNGSCAPTRGECDPWAKHELELCVRDGGWGNTLQGGQGSQSWDLAPGRMGLCPAHIISWQEGKINHGWGSAPSCRVWRGVCLGIWKIFRMFPFIYVCVYVFYTLQFIIIILQSMVWVGRNLKTMKF